MPSTILTYDQSKLPAAMLGMPHHPSADAYMEGLRTIQRAIVAQSQKMKRNTVLAIKQHHRGVSTTEIAKELKIGYATISKVIKSESGQKLIALLAYYQEAIDGPQEAQRRHMLWRIAANNEEIAPKVTISAVAELNKMDNIGKEAQANIQTGDINIIINNQLSRTALDG
jgi:hypothetical protein